MTGQPKKKMQHTNVEPWSDPAQPKRLAQEESRGFPREIKDLIRRGSGELLCRYSYQLILW